MEKRVLSRCNNRGPVGDGGGGGDGASTFPSTDSVWAVDAAILLRQTVLPGAAMLQQSPPLMSATFRCSATTTGLKLKNFGILGLYTQVSISAAII